MRVWPLCAIAAGLVVLVECARESATAPAAEPVMRIAAGDGQTGLPGDTLPVPLRVHVVQGGGAPAPGYTITWEISSGAVVSPSTVTDDSGDAATRIVLGQDTGEVIIRAQLKNGAGVSTAQQFTARAKDPCGTVLTLAVGDTVTGSISDRDCPYGDGSYLDVFGYVPPDEDFNPQHPLTRTEAKRHSADVLRWSRQNLGVVGTEAGCDWTAPFVDYASPLGPGKAGIPVPLFSLVYHDAVMTPYSPTTGGGEARMNRVDRPNWLFGMINGGFPRTGLEQIERQRDVLNQMTTLHRRVALLAMTNHEFLDPNFRRERATYADGTTVTVDWEAKTVVVAPELK